MVVHNLNGRIFLMCCSMCCEAAHPISTMDHLIDEDQPNKNVFRMFLVPKHLKMHLKQRFRPGWTAESRNFRLWRNQDFFDAYQAPLPENTELLAVFLTVFVPHHQPLHSLCVCAGARVTVCV